MLHSAFSIRYRAEIFSADGTLRDSREGHNLVMAAAIPKFFQRTGSPLYKLKVGSGTRANRVDSGAVTFTNNWVNNSAQFTLTASAGFFTSDMVGATLRLASGDEMTVAAVGSSTSATVNATAAAPASAVAGVVHLDNQTGLATEIAGFANGTTFSAPTYVVTRADVAGAFSVTYTRVATSSTSTAGYTIKELGWYDSGNTFLGRVDLSAAPLVPQTGDYIQVTLSDTWVIDCAAKAVSTLGAFNGTSRWYGGPSSWFSANAWAGVGFSNDSNTFKLMSGGTPPDLSVLHTAGYSAGTTIDSANLTEANTAIAPSVVRARSSGTVTGGALTFHTIGFGGYGNAWLHKLDAPIAKANLQGVTITYDRFITRTLPA